MVVGSKSVLDGYEGHGPALSSYHRSIPEKVLSVKGGDQFKVGAMEVKVTTTRHSDPSGVGFILGTQNGAISYMSDTEFDYEVIQQHEGSRIIILCLTRPLKSRVSNHICTEDALEIAQMLRPQMIILTHFGAKLVHEGCGQAGDVHRGELRGEDRGGRGPHEHPCREGHPGLEERRTDRARPRRGKDRQQRRSLMDKCTDDDVERRKGSPICQRVFHHTILEYSDNY